MKQTINLLLIPLLFLFSMTINAQSCPSSGSVTLSTTSTPNTCGGNGTITATFSPSGSSSNITVQLLKSGTEIDTEVNTTSPFTFDNLQPGTDYQVRLVCSTDNSVIYLSEDETVLNNYVPITAADISTSDVCANFTPGGTFTVNSVTGGTPSYEYKIVQSTDPAFPDTIGTYGSSNVLTANQFGTYQIRVKDACGNYMTFTRSIAATVPPLEIYWKPKEICGNTTQAQGTLWWTRNVLTGSGAVTSDYFPSPGVHMVIRADNASGAVLYDDIYDGGTFTYTMNPSHVYHVTITTACGQTSTYTNTMTNANNNPEFLNFVPVASTSGCGVSEMETISINFDQQSFWSFPVTIVVKDSSGNPVQTSTSNGGIWTSASFPVGTYTVEVSDNCTPKNTIIKTVDNPQNAGTPSLFLQDRPKWRCGTNGSLILTQVGTTQAVVRIDGYFPDRANAVVTITAPSPSNVGVQGEYVDNQYWAWTNLLPGTYTVSYTSCGTTYTDTFFIDNHPNVLLNISLTSTATSFCTGGGSIASNFAYNGSYNYDIQLLNSSNTVVASNTTGNFSNIAPGTYTTRVRIKPCGSSAYYYYIPGSTVTITNSSTGPSISSSVGIICEDANGNPLSTGSAYLDLNGVAPLKLRYRESGTSTWTIIDPASTNTVISGLIANTLYELELIDGCGGSTPSSVIIKTMGTLSSSNTAHPCNGDPYALAIPYYSGATYQWVNPSGAVVSNTRTYAVANWDNSYNGTYMAKITWSNCVTRYVYLTLNSNQCGQPITAACYKSPDLVGGIPTQHGITSLQRAGNQVADQDNWPMVRESAHTVLESKTKGFVINRVATDANGQVPTSVIATPVEGMTIYDTTNNCLKIYDGTSWECFTKADCPD